MKIQMSLFSVFIFTYLSSQDTTALIKLPWIKMKMPLRITNLTFNLQDNSYSWRMNDWTWRFSKRKIPSQTLILYLSSSKILASMTLIVWISWNLSKFLNDAIVAQEVGWLLGRSYFTQSIQKFGKCLPQIYDICTSKIGIKIMQLGWHLGRFFFLVHFTTLLSTSSKFSVNILIKTLPMNSFVI